MKNPKSQFVVEPTLILFVLVMAAVGFTMLAQNLIAA